MTRATLTRNTRTRPGPQPLSPATVIRGLAALILLAALIGGVPVALAALARVLPIRWPPPNVRDLLTAPDDGSVLLLILLGIGWAAWAIFTLTVAVEAAALLRGRSLPHLPAVSAGQRPVSAGQRPAAHLVAAVAVLFATAGVSLVPAAGRPVTAHAAASTASALDHAPAVGTEVASAAPGVASNGAAPAADRHPYPTVTVQLYDSYWALAERHLGSGTRYAEIVDLNRDRRQPDGRRVVDAETLLPGWVLRLPRDARHLPPPTRQTPPAASHVGEKPDAHRAGTYRVRAGDTLWDIAAEHLGDPLRFSELFRLNRNIVQPDGGRLTDPAEIMPGWILTLPAPQKPSHDFPATSTPQPVNTNDGNGTATPTIRPTPWIATPAAEQERTDRAKPPPVLAPGSAPVPATPSPPATGSTQPTRRAEEPSPYLTSVVPRSSVQPGVNARPGTDADAPAGDGLTQRPTAAAGAIPSGSLSVEHRASPGGNPSPLAMPSVVTRTPMPPRLAVDASDSADASGDDDGMDLSAAPVLLAGLSGVLLTGVVREVRRRRRHQQATRQVGQRLPTPAPQAEQLERRAAAAETPTVTTAMQALQRMAVTCAAEERLLPQVRLVSIGADDVRLHLTPADGDATPVAPFRAVAPSVWSYRPGDADASGPEEVPEDGCDVPYRGLVTLGIAEDRVIVVNLEEVGHLSLTGDPDMVAAALRGIAADMAVGPFSVQSFSAFAGCCPELAKVSDLRVGYLDSTAAAEGSIRGALRQTFDRRACWRDCESTHIVLANDPLGISPAPYWSARWVADLDPHVGFPGLSKENGNVDASFEAVVFAGV